MGTQTRVLAWLGAMTAIIANLSIAPTGPAWTVEPASPQVDGAQQHEYRLISGRLDRSVVNVPIPQPPAGVTYTRMSLSDGDELQEPFGLLQRSDGQVVGVGPKKRRLVAGIGGDGHKEAAMIREEFPGASIIDFGCPAVGQTRLLLADGTVKYRWEGASVIPAPQGIGVHYTAFVQSSYCTGYPVLLQSDGRITAHIISRDSTTGKVKWRRTITTEANDYVGGTIAMGEERRRAWPFAVLLRRDGRADTLDLSMNSQGRSQLTQKTLEVPKLKKGTRFVSVSASTFGLIYLRSDGRLVYRGRPEYPPTRYPQPPKPPVGLRYTGVELFDTGIVRLFRSDRQVLNLDMKTVHDGKYVLRYPHKVPKLAKGWKFLDVGSGLEFSGDFLVERILPGETVESGIARVGVPSAAARGKTVKVKAKVASRAVLDGGIVRVTHKGKTIGQAKVKGSTATIKIKTKTFKKKGKNTIGVQYLGNYQAKKSVKAKAVVITS